MNLCLRYFYSNINGHKPSYYRLNISGSKTQNNGLIEYSVFSDKNKESTSMPLALRMLYDQCEFVLHSSEISVRSKLLFIENMNGLFNSQPSLKNQFMKTHNSMNYFNT